MAQQLDLFRKTRRPAQPNPRTMFVLDASAESHSGRAWIRLWCSVCDHKTAWVPARSPAVELKGRVCPKCKGDPANVTATVKPTGGTADQEPS